MRLLFTVTDRFAIQGRGVVLCPGVPIEGVRASFAVRIERPDGTSVTSRAFPEHASGFSSVEAAERFARGPRAVCVTGVAADDVPRGSRVWAVEAEERE